MKKIVVVFASLLVVLSCNKKSDAGQPASKEDSELMKRAQAVFVSVSTVKPDNIPTDKVELGKKLYLDNRLSKNNTISCNSCHDLNNYGVDNQARSMGDSKELGGRNSPSSFYAFLQFKQFWDGRAKDVEEQAKGPILNPVEHGIPDPEYLVAKLRKIPEYQDMFKKVYPNDKEPITFDNIANAIGAFERQLYPESRFDKYLDGDNNALTQKERQGLKDFMDARCIICHNGVDIGGGMFQKFGLFGDYVKETKSDKKDNGVFDITKKDADKFFFKVPSLRNIEKTSPYFHDGSVKDLKQAVRIMGKLQVNEQLTEEQVDNITTFLASLTADIDKKYK